MIPEVDLVGGFEDLEVLVVGDAMLDTYLLGESERLCQQAPVPVVDVRERRDAPGGAANVAENVRALGARATLVGLVGDDAEGSALRRAVAGAGIDDRLITLAERGTLAKTRVVSEGHLLVRVDRGSVDAPTSDDQRVIAAALRAAWRRCDAVAIADYGYGALPPIVVDELADLQRAWPRVVVVDAKDVARYRRVGVTAAKPNFEQAVRLLGETVLDGARAEQVAARAERLHDATGAPIVTVTLDHDGALAFERGRPSYRTYAQPTRSATTSGAGDTFSAALTLALGAGATMPIAVELASAAASVVVEKDGTATCSGAELRVRVGGGRKLASDAAEAAIRAEVARRSGRRVVFTNGCFDLLHRGHVTYLSRAKALGDVLVVGVNADESVRALKGPSRPINQLEDRMEVLAALSCVDLVVPFSEPTPERLIEAVRPDVFVKGGDYTREMLPEASVVERLGGDVTILPYVDDRSTTGMIERIRTEVG